MGTAGNGPTLEGLAQRLEALTEKLGGLERENEALRTRVATLSKPDTRSSEVVALKGSDMRVTGGKESVSKFNGRVSRQSLLSKAGAAAVAAMAAGTLLYPRKAKAHHYDDNNLTAGFILTHFLAARTGGDPNWAGGSAIQAETTSDGEGAVHGINNGAGPGVRGLNIGTGSGVHGEGGIGVHGQTEITGNGAVYGQHTGGQGYGVVGDGRGNASAGVLGRNPFGQGVRGMGSIGVQGKSEITGNAAVHGQHTGTGEGYGVVGDGVGVGAGVLGRNSSTNAGIGVKGQGNIIGVKGESTNGYGGHFQGARAQVKLLPHPNSGRPTTGVHQQGELFLDSAARLFICTASGTPGTWRKVATTAA